MLSIYCSLLYRPQYHSGEFPNSTFLQLVLAFSQFQSGLQVDSHSTCQIVKF